AVDPHSPRPDDGCKPGSTAHPQNSRNARSPACARQTQRKTTRPEPPILPDWHLGHVLVERIRPIRICPWKHSPSSSRGAKLECSVSDSKWSETDPPFSQSAPSAHPTFPPLPPAAPPPLSSRDTNSALPEPSRPAPPRVFLYLRPAVSADQFQFRPAPALHIPSLSSRPRRAQKYPPACRNAGSGTCSCFPPPRALPHSPGGTFQSLCAHPPAPPLTASSPRPLPSPPPSGSTSVVRRPSPAADQSPNNPAHPIPRCEGTA